MKRPANPPSRHPNARPRFAVPMSTTERRRFQRAADRAHLPLATWIRVTCLRVVDEERAR